MKTLQPYIDYELSQNALSFMGKPDRWYEHFTVRCEHGHVSKMVLKTNQGDACLACGAPVLLTFPEDTDGPLMSLEEFANLLGE